MYKRIWSMLITFTIIISIPMTINAFTIVLDSGHGGNDVGSVSDDGSNTYEKDINLKLTKYLKEYLQEYEDVNVILTHEGFESGDLAIFDRAMIARNNHADLFISLHNNSYTGAQQEGAEVYVTANKSLPKYNEETTKLANKILDNLMELNITSRGVKTRLIPTDETDVYSDGTRADYYGVIRYAMRGCKIDKGIISCGTPANVQNGEGIPTILVEHCFIKGPDFLKFLNTDEKIKKLAMADGKAIVEYYGLHKKNETNVLEEFLLDKTTFNILKDTSMTLTLNLKPMNVKIEDLVWTSSDDKIATISDKGVVTGIKKGMATIKVTSKKYYKSASMTINVTELNESEAITIEKLHITNEYLTKIEPGTTVEELKNNVLLTDNLMFEVLDNNSNIIETTDKVASDYNVVIKNKEKNEVIQEYKVLIYGDADGDGNITTRDLYNIQRHILKISPLNSTGKKAANLDKDGAEPTTRDLYNIQRHILKKKFIQQ